MNRDNKSEWCPSRRFTTHGKGERVNFTSTATSTKCTHPTTLKLAVGDAPFCNYIQFQSKQQQQQKDDNCWPS